MRTDFQFGTGHLVRGTGEVLPFLDDAIAGADHGAFKPRVGLEGDLYIVVFGLYDDFLLLVAEVRYYDDGVLAGRDLYREVAVEVRYDAVFRVLVDDPGSYQRKAFIVQDCAFQSAGFALRSAGAT